MRKKMEQKMNKLKELHDRVKEHPYWLNFDSGLFRDVNQMYEEMIKILSETSPAVFSHDGMIYYANQYGAVGLSLVHDLRNRMCYGSKYEKGSEKFGKMIWVMQTFLMIIHQYIDGEGEPQYKTIPNDIAKYSGTIKAECRGAKGWIKVCEVKEEDRQKVVELYEYLRNKSPYNKEWYDKYIEDLKVGDTDYFRFV